MSSLPSELLNEDIIFSKATAICHSELAVGPYRIHFNVFDFGLNVEVNANIDKE